VDNEGGDLPGNLLVPKLDRVFLAQCSVGYQVTGNQRCLVQGARSRAGFIGR
jgi:hypothetical protein